MRSWKQLKEFSEDYVVVYDRMEILESLSYFGIDDLENDITAIAVEIGDGEIIDLWYSLDNAPWNNNSIYEHVSTIETDDYQSADDLVRTKNGNLPFDALD